MVTILVLKVYNALVRISNSQPEFECQPSSHKRDRELTIICYVKKTQGWFCYKVEKKIAG